MVSIFICTFQQWSNHLIFSWLFFPLFQKLLTKSLNGCFSGISHSSLIVMYLKEQFGRLHSMQALRIRIPKFTGNTQLLHSLIKVSEEVNSESVLLIQLVSVCILHSIHSMGGRHVLQEDVPARKENQSRRHCWLHNRPKTKQKQWRWIKNSV